jgi:hypothetical protein
MVCAERYLRIRWSGALFCVLLFLSGLYGPVAQDQVMEPPRVSVVTPAHESDSPQHETLAFTMARTMSFSLRLLGDYRIEPVPPGEDEGLDPENRDGAARLAVENDLDYLIVGRLGESDSGGIVFAISVWDREAGEFTIRQEAVAESIFDTFDVADEVTREILSAMSGRRIAFGTVRLELPDGVGPVFVFVDGEYVGYDVPGIESIPAGERFIEVVPVGVDDPENGRTGRSVVVNPEGVTVVALEVEAGAFSGPYPRLLDGDGGAGDGTDGDRGTGDGAAEDPEVAEIPEWFDPGFALGMNPDRGFFESPAFAAYSDGGAGEGAAGGDWFHTPARWESPAARYPVVDWRIDGSLDEWPWTVPYYPIDPRRSPQAHVQVLEYQLAYAPDAIYLSILLGRDWQRFLANREPAVYLETTMTGRDSPVRRNFAIKRRGGRWTVETRENRNPIEDFPFVVLSDGMAATREERLEVRIPLDWQDGPEDSPFMEVTDISLEQGVDGSVLEVYRSGPPLRPRFERRVR